MSLIKNERRKPSANALNGLAVATMAAGFIAPLVAVSYGVSSTRAGIYFAGTGLIWFFSAIVLHWMAVAILGGLKE